MAIDRSVVEKAAGLARIALTSDEEALCPVPSQQLGGNVFYCAPRGDRIAEKFRPVARPGNDP